MQDDILGQAVRSGYLSMADASRIANDAVDHQHGLDAFNQYVTDRDPTFNATQLPSPASADRWAAYDTAHQKADLNAQLADLYGRARPMDNSLRSLTALSHPDPRLYGTSEDLAGLAAQGRHMSSQYTDPQTLSLDDVLTGARDWIPQIGGALGSVPDALSYAAHRVANGQSDASVPPLGWGPTAHHAVQSALQGTGLVNDLPPPRGEATMEGIHEPSLTETAMELMNPAFMVSPAGALKKARAAADIVKGGVQDVLSPARHFIPLETATTGSGLESVGRPFNSRSLMTHIQGDVAGDAFGGIPGTDYEHGIPLAGGHDAPLLRGQGYWGNEANPLFVGELPHDITPEARDYLSGMAAARSGPQAAVAPYSVRRPIFDRNANAMAYPRPDRATIAAIARQHGNDMIVADNPHLNALLLRSYGNEQIPSAVSAQMQQVLGHPGLPVRAEGPYIEKYPAEGKDLQGATLDEYRALFPSLAIGSR